MAIWSKKKVKKIKTAKYLYFTFDDDSSNLTTGTKFSYIVSDNEIIIVPDEQAKNTITKKKVGSKEKPLIAIREKKVSSKVQSADFLKVIIKKDSIIVKLCKKVVSTIIKSDIISLSDILGNRNELNIAVGQQFSIFDFISNPSVLEEHNESDRIKHELNTVFDTISLFSGAGMLDFPFYEDKKFNIRFACDYDLDATKSYSYNVGNHIVCGDVRDVKNLGKTDLIIGGPSCKAFSNANRYLRLLEHPDYFLVKEYIRIVKESEPSVFVVENVPEFVSANDGELLKSVLNELSDYEISVNIVCDAECGGFTKRKRAILIGSRIGIINLPELKPVSTKTVKDALSKVDSSWFNYNDITKSNSATKLKMSFVKDGGNWEDIPVELRDKGVHSNHYRRLNPDDLAPTLVNFRKVCMMPPTSSPNPNRILSVAEASALSGFNKSFRFLGSLSSRQQQVGNGVPYFIGKLIKNTVKRALTRSKSMINPLFA